MKQPKKHKTKELKQAGEESTQEQQNNKTTHDFNDDGAESTQETHKQQNNS